MMDFKELIIYLLPAYFVFVGFVSNMIKNKAIDKKYGYRTRLSMKSKQNWYFANDFMAKGCFLLAIFFIALGFILSYYIDMTGIRKGIFIFVEFISYISLGIFLENRLKTLHKK